MNALDMHPGVKGDPMVATRQRTMGMMDVERFHGQEIDVILSAAIRNTDTDVDAAQFIGISRQTFIRWLRLRSIARKKISVPEMAKEIAGAPFATGTPA